MVEMLLSLAPVLVPFLGAVAGIRFVSEGERALLLRFDKAVTKRNGEYKVIMPGLRLMIPGAHKLARIHVRQRTINLPSQTIVLADSTVFDVSAVILCRVKDTAQDLYNALFETTGINLALTDYGLIVIREVLADKTYENLVENRSQISNELFQAIQAQADGWGVEIIKFELSDCDPSPETARLMQTRVQTKFRLTALKEAATDMGLTSPVQLNTTLGAVLVGVPLVANVSNMQSASALNRDDEGDD